MKSITTEHIVIRILFLLVLVGLSSCQAGHDPETDSRPQIVPESSEMTTAELAPDSNAEQIAVDEPAAEPRDECIICHSDQQMLVDTAKPEVIKEVENSGEG